MAHADDGLIEAYYDPKATFVVGLQFHPERMLPEYSGNEEVWKAFASAVHRYSVSAADISRPTFPRLLIQHDRTVRMAVLESAFRRRFLVRLLRQFVNISNKGFAPTVLASTLAVNHI